jgi:hypothetical protein
MTPASSASVRMFESVRALTAEENLSTGDPKNVALEFVQPAHGAAAVIFDHAPSGCFLRRADRG